MRKLGLLEQRGFMDARLRQITGPRPPAVTREFPASMPARRERFGLAQLGSLAVSSMLLLLVWQGITTLLATPTWLLPSPIAVAARFGRAAADGTLAQHVIPTLIESVGGFFLALAAGATLGYGVAHSRRLERWIAPYVAAIQAIPVIAIAPLVLIWFGYSSDVIRNILIAAIVVVFPIFSSTIAAVRTIPRELREVGLVEGANRWQRLRFIELPLALPVLFSGFRTSLAYATTGAVVGEFIGSRYGLGALINVARGFFDTPLIFVAMLCLGIITLAFYSVVLVLERTMTPWAE